MNKRYLLFIFSFCLWVCSGLVAQVNPYTDSLYTLLQSDIPDTNQVEHLNRLGWELQYSNPDSAIVLSLQAVQTCMVLIEDEKIKLNQGAFKKVKKSLAQSFNCLGVFYWMASDYATSIEYHKKALAMRREMGDQLNEGASLNNLGLTYKAQGNYNEALKSYFAALSIAINGSDKDLISDNLTNIGTVYHDMKEYSKALNFYFMAIKIYKEVENSIGLSMTYSYIGNALVKLNHFEKALEYYNKGFYISKNIQNLYLEAFQTNNIGEVYVYMQDHSAGLTYFQQSLPLSREVGDMALVSTVLGNLGKTHMALNNHEEAEKCLMEALSIARDIKAYPEIEINAKTLSDLYAKKGNFTKAYQLQNEYLLVHEKLFNDTKTKELGQLETRHELALEAREKQREEEDKLKAEKAKKRRIENLQNTGIALGLLLIGTLIIILGLKKVSVKMANAITFLATLILFEFLLVLFDPLVDRISFGQPLYKLVCNIIMAIAIFPVHGLMVKLLKSKLSKTD